jgi:hypothetical protein
MTCWVALGFRRIDWPWFRLAMVIAYIEFIFRLCERTGRIFLPFELHITVRLNLEGYPLQKKRWTTLFHLLSNSLSNKDCSHWFLPKQRKILTRRIYRFEGPFSRFYHRYTALMTFSALGTLVIWAEKGNRTYTDCVDFIPLIAHVL